MATKVNTQLAAVFLQVSPETVRRRIRSGCLKANKDPWGYYKIEMSEILRVLSEEEDPWPRPSAEVNRMEEEFLLRIREVSEEPTEEAQKKLVHLAMSILATQHNPALYLSGKEARATVWRWVHALSGNPAFNALMLTGDLFRLYQRSHEQQAA